MILSIQGIGGLYIGYGANYAYAYPVDAAKFLLYESAKASSPPSPPPTPHLPPT